MINQGKLAVVLGIEVSEPFGCQVYNDQPQCDAAQIDRGLDEVYKLGVRDMELINKFDNALAGVAGDTGTTGAVVNGGNKLETGKYWQMQPCHGPPDESDRGVPRRLRPRPRRPRLEHPRGVPARGRRARLPRGRAVQRARPHHLGEHLIRRMMDKGMVVDPDHLSVLARKQVMSILEAAKHGGVVSSHTLEHADAIPRIYKLGGFVPPTPAPRRASSRPGRRPSPRPTRATTSASATGRT